MLSYLGHPLILERAMISIKDLDKLLMLKKLNDEQELSFKEMNYDEQIKIIAEDEKRRVLSTILAQAKYKPLLEMDQWWHEGKRLNFYAYSLQDNREDALLNARKLFKIKFIRPVLISDYCREVAVAFAKLVNPELDEIKNKKRIHEITWLSSRTAYYSKLNQSIEDIASCSMADCCKQLMIIDSVEEHTIGHLCFAEKRFITQYLEIYAKLSAAQQYRILSLFNKQSQSILDLCGSIHFFSLVKSLEQTALSDLLTRDNIFDTIISHMENEQFLHDYWLLLKAQFNDSLADLFHKQEHKERVDEAFIRFLPAEFLIEYLPVHKALFSPQNIHFMKCRLAHDPDYKKDEPQQRAEIMLTYLKLFSFNSKALHQLACIKHLKKDVANYLLALPETDENKQLLEDICAGKSSLGEFCWQWRSSMPSMYRLFSSTSEPAVPTTIKKIRLWLSMMNEPLVIASAPYELEGVAEEQEAVVVDAVVIN